MLFDVLKLEIHLVAFKDSFSRNTHQVFATKTCQLLQLREVSTVYSVIVRKMHK